MLKRKNVFLIISLSAAAFVAQTLSQTQNPGGASPVPDWARQRNMTAEERSKEMLRQSQLRQEQMQKAMEQAHDEAYRQLIGANKRQWQVIKPKIDKVRDVSLLTRASIMLDYFKIDPNSNSKTGSQNGYKYGWKWIRPSEREKSDESENKFSSVGISTTLDSKKLNESTEGEKICEELLNLLEDKNSKEEDIRQKIEALLKVRQKGQEEVNKAKQELREVVTFRQEAALVWLGLVP